MIGPIRRLRDLIVDDDDLYGDGVNVAARLEAEAPAGGVVVSGTVRDFVGERVKARFDDRGSLTLKNIERPVQAYEVRWDASDWPITVPTAVTESVTRTAAAPSPETLPCSYRKLRPAILMMKSAKNRQDSELTEPLDRPMAAADLPATACKPE